MEATPHAPGEPIVLSQIMPTPIRLIFGGVGLAGTILLLVGLGPALWPPSFLTLFCGIIVLGGLSVTLAFVACSALGPDQTWEISPGKLTITYQLFNQTSVKTYDLHDLESCEVASSLYWIWCCVVGTKGWEIPQTKGEKDEKEQNHEDT